MRVTHHPILSIKPKKEVTITVDGKPILAREGESVAAALLANGIRVLRYSEKMGEARGIYCGIGHCYECRIHLKDVGEIRACITPVEEGMELTVKRGGRQGES